MSLDDLKNTWDQLNEATELQSSLSNAAIQKALETKYRSRLLKIFFPQIVLIAAALYFSALIVVMFNQLETIYLKCLGVLSVFLLAVFIVLRMKQVIQIYRLSFISKSYAEVVKQFAVQKIRTQKLLKFNIALGFFLLVSLFVLNVKLYNEFDVTKNINFWIATLAVSLAIIIIYNIWWANYYQKSFEEAGLILEELEH